MAIVQGVQYDPQGDKFLGDVTLPEHEGYASQAFVFVLGGITSRWKQTVAYFFSGNSCKGVVLHDIILSIIKEAEDIGLKIICITCDMASANRAMWKAFGINVGKYAETINKIVHPYDSSRSIYFIADLPHILKNFRAPLLNNVNIILSADTVHKYNLPTNVVDLHHIINLANYQSDCELKLAPELTLQHLSTHHFQKMKVNIA
ncbi:uncharacterized protein LOC111614933, partial [Centruroides sculpturatus]|uniref:uncharacterized protein LOC111614933 n=1 Tax=Centruroides sculpturatus TaxID=218467 RepID=UPI000C6E0B5B